MRFDVEVFVNKMRIVIIIVVLNNLRFHVGLLRAYARSTKLA
jgi:hypothetical protein